MRRNCSQGSTAGAFPQYSWSRIKYAIFGCLANNMKPKFGVQCSRNLSLVISEDIGLWAHESRHYRLEQKKGIVLLSTSQAQQGRTFSQLSDLSFAWLCSCDALLPCPVLTLSCDWLFPAFRPRHTRNVDRKTNLLLDLVKWQELDNECPDNRWKCFTLSPVNTSVQIY